jgi:hypothetical protein
MPGDRQQCVLFPGDTIQEKRQVPKRAVTLSCISTASSLDSQKLGAPRGLVASSEGGRGRASPWAQRNRIVRLVPRQGRQVVLRLLQAGGCSSKVHAGPEPLALQLLDTAGSYEAECRSALSSIMAWNETAVSNDLVFEVVLRRAGFRSSTLSVTDQSASIS